VNEDQKQFSQLVQKLDQILNELAEFVQTPEARAFDSNVPISGYETFFDDLRVFLEQLRVNLEDTDLNALEATSANRGRFLRWAAELGFTDTPIGQRILDLVYSELRSSLEDE
jgi:hypothetical protein